MRFRLRYVLLCGVLALFAAPTIVSQGAHLPQPTQQAWEKEAGGAMSFEVVSVRPDRSDLPPSINVSPTTGDDFTPTHGLYRSRNIVLVQTIAFAYKLSNKQLQSVTKQYPWTAKDNFDIEARAAGNPTKDQYRLMVQALLAERFGLRAHFETRVTPVFALVFAKPGQFGPHLRLHGADDPVCAPGAPLSKGPVLNDAAGFPSYCGGPVGMSPSVPGLMHTGGRGITLALFASLIAGVGDVDRPIINATGIQGPVDYSLEWAKVQANLLPGETLPPEGTGPTFSEALREQMGLKLQPRRAPLEFFLIDHLSQPTEN